MYNFDIYIFEKLSLFLNPILFPVIRKERERERGGFGIAITKIKSRVTRVRVASTTEYARIFNTGGG